MQESLDMTLRPSIKEYEEIGKEICFLCSKLSTFACKLGNDTGVSKEPYMHARDALRSLDRCKSTSEDLMFFHYPNLDREAVNVFYHKLENSQDEP
jgi:hypothetical protein